MDQRVPDNIIEFVKFINKLVNIISGLTNCEKLYIHCKGGHGRRWFNSCNSSLCYG